ncbi:tubby-like protein 8 [Silene latifolia]|uniref:tubby-like protein 8 n=1 Tax=Silene latifolia TaxID=37657 RepID=UPI003D76EF1F
MAGLKKPTILRQISYNSHYSNPLIDHKNSENCSEKCTDTVKITPLGAHLCLNKNVDKKDSKNPMKFTKVGNFSDDKENAGVNEGELFNLKNKNPKNLSGNLKECKKDRILKPGSSSSLQLCIQMNEPDSSFGFGFGFGLKGYDAGEETESAKSVNVWDFSDSEAAPVSSWSTLPNRALLCRTLPMDVGRCTCIIQKEAAPHGLGGGSIYSLFTNEGQGRQNRKLAVAHHKRRNGRSIFIIAQNAKGLMSFSDDSFVGAVTSNLMGSRYYVYDQGRSPRRKLVKESKLLQAVVEFTPTIRTWTGSYRSMRAWIPKQQQPLQSKNTNTQQMKGLPLEWDGNQVQLLHSKVPYYNKSSKQYELDFREKVKAGLKIQSSVKNFQLTMEENGRQTILQLCRIGKSKYILDYRHPLTGYQAFCICLASIDPKLCCTV